jgi:hypothetical protein
VTLEGVGLVKRTTGKNLVTRKEWVKEERAPLSTIAGILVTSRDRRTFHCQIETRAAKSPLVVEGCTDKSELDAFLHDVSRAMPTIPIELAHPSYGLSDPVHESARLAAETANKHNRAEEDRRKKAAGTRPEVKVKTYDNHKDYARDAKKMSNAGWMPQGDSADRGKVSVKGTAGKLILTGGLGAITGFSRKSGKITVTWVKQPPGFIPQEFMEVGEVPPPRRFPHEAYFEAVNLDPVQPGQEFPPITEAPSVDEDSLNTTGASEEASTPVAGGTIADKIRQLKSLRDENLISEEEFEAKRASLLERL